MNDDALPCDHFCKYLSVQSTSCDALSQHCIGHRKMEQKQKQTSSICARSIVLEAPCGYLPHPFPLAALSGTTYAR